MYEQPMAFKVGLVGCKPTVQKVQHFANADQRGLPGDLRGVLGVNPSSTAFKQKMSGYIAGFLFEANNVAPKVIIKNQDAVSRQRFKLYVYLLIDELKKALLKSDDPYVRAYANSLKYPDDAQIEAAFIAFGPENGSYWDPFANPYQAANMIVNSFLDSISIDVYREEKIDAVTVGLSEKVKNAFNALVPILNSCTEGVATGQTSYCTAQAALVMEIRNILISQNKDVSQTLLSFEGGLYAEEADIASIFAGFGGNTTYQGYTITYTPPTATTSASLSFKKGGDAVVVNNFEQQAKTLLTKYGFLSFADLEGVITVPSGGIGDNPLPLLIAQKTVREYAWLRAKYPDWSKARCLVQAEWNVISSGVHFILDVAGLVPVAGEIPDLINGGVYLLEGNGTDAALSFAATVPIGGAFATLGKWTKKALKYNGDGAFQTVSGLIFKLGSRDGNRISHALYHLADAPTRRGIHSYFSSLATQADLIGFLSDQWASIISKSWNPSLAEGATQTIGNITKKVERNPQNNVLQDIYTIDFGSTVIGKEGGLDGTGTALNKVKIIVFHNTSEIITSYPVR